MRSIITALVAGGLWSAPGVAAPAPEDAAPSPDVLAFDRFIAFTGPICEHQPAPECVDLAWDFADFDGDGVLSGDELWLVRDMLEAWAGWRADGLSTRDQNGIALGLWVVDTIGLDRLRALYDADGDGAITRRELLADVRLDERTLSETLLDPASVDRAAIVKRLRALVPFLEPALE